MFDRLPSCRRCCLIALALSLSAAGLAVADPAWARAIGVDVWNVPALQQQARDAVASNEEIDAADEHLMRRMEVKEALVRDLIAGRATLAEVTARFYEMNVSRPNNMDVIRNCFAGETDEEKMARNVIGYALPRAESDQREALERRLNAELEQMLAGSATH